jgi:hypothetical protein
LPRRAHAHPLLARLGAHRTAAYTSTTSQGEPTLPSLLGDELAVNPFLRPHDPEIRAAVGLPPGAADWEVFGAVRRAKDGPRGRFMLAFYAVWDRLPAPLGRAIAALF